MDPIHILVRIPRSGRTITQVVAAHNEVISDQGAVWLGIVGRALPQSVVAKLNQQTQNRTRTHIYLVQKNSGFTVFEGNILAATFELPKSEQRLIPPYLIPGGDPMRCLAIDPQGS